MNALLKTTQKSSSTKDTKRIRTYNDKGVSIDFVPVGNFPSTLFEEWDNDCKANFNNCRWMKMWSDHQAAQIVKAKMEVIATQSQPQQQEQTNDNELGLMNPDV